MREFETFSEKRDWIETALFNINEGVAQAEEVEALRELLSNDREARLIYLKSNQLDFMLTSMSEKVWAPEEMSASEKVTPFNRTHIKRSHFLSGLVGAGIAASITLVAWFSMQDDVLLPGVSTPHEPLANVVAEHEAVFEDAEASKDKNLNEGDVSLDQGIAELAFRNGARVVLQGKCGFEIVDAMTVVLNHGKLWAYCPPEAYGFKVLTPGDHEIIDLGTEFGVEVDETGETDVHVFDGLVEVKKKSVPESRMVVAGDALAWLESSSSAETGQADVSKFVTQDDLNRRRLEKYQASLLERDDLMRYYNFSQLENDTVINQAPGATPGDAGKVHNVVPVTGRVSGNRALLFDDPEARIDLDLNFTNDHQSFTIAMWVNVDRLDRTLSALMNSNGWRKGDTHIHIARDGALRVGVMGIGTYQSAVSGIVKPGYWQLIAVIWDADKNEFTFYCDGEHVETFEKRKTVAQSHTVQPNFGDCRIGSWDPIGISYTPPAAERAFKGRIDEVLVFDRALSSDELTELNTMGKPMY